jgi:hypothetical protein
MAFDWLKVEKITPDKPEITILSRKLGLSLGDAFLSWFRVYSWADTITRDGRVPYMSLEDGDRLSRCCPGTCAALASKEIGWLSTKQRRGVEVIQFSNWERHNGKSAKNRALESEKKRNQRAKKCPEKTGTNVPKMSPPRVRARSLPLSPLISSLQELPEDLRTEEFLCLYKTWFDYRQKLKKPLNEHMVEQQIKKMAAMGIERATAMIEHTIAMGWQGLREPETATAGIPRRTANTLNAGEQFMQMEFPNGKGE